MGNEASSAEESFGLDGARLEYPHYTRPARFREWDVPEVLRSGDHARVARWRRAQAIIRTRARRPDLVPGPPTPEEQRLLDEFPPDGADR
jgi:tRNA (guanine37-N1)-methyltransferase